MFDVYARFLEDDGWAMASHVALSALMSMFPFLIFVTALAGFFGSKQLADEVVRILFESWPQQASAPIAAEIHNVLTQSRGDVLTFGCETTGLPSDVIAAFAPDARLRIPMRRDVRSLNLSNAVAVAVYEAWRQTGLVGAV